MITQTILHADPERPGNCFATCVATVCLGRGFEYEQEGLA